MTPFGIQAVAQIAVKYTCTISLTFGVRHTELIEIWSNFFHIFFHILSSATKIEFLYLKNTPKQIRITNVFNSVTIHLTEFRKMYLHKYNRYILEVCGLWMCFLEGAQKTD